MSFAIDSTHLLFTDAGARGDGAADGLLLLLVDGGGRVPDPGVRAERRAQPLERDVGRAREPGGRGPRGGVRDRAAGHRAAGRAPKLHARGHGGRDGGRPAPVGPGPGLRAAHVDVPVERVPHPFRDRADAAHVPAAVRDAGDAWPAGRPGGPVRRGRHGVAALGVRRRAAPAGGRARRVRGAVLAGQLDARGHRGAAQPLVPGRVAHGPTDARHVPRAAGQRARLRAHRAGPVVPRRGRPGPPR